MSLLDLLGAAAGVLTTVAFVPQVVKTWRSGSAQDISLVMFSLFSAGVLLWLLYGIALHSLPIVAANAVTLALASSVLALKVRHLRAQRRERAAAGERPL